MFFNTSILLKEFHVLGAPWEPLGPPSVHLHVLCMYPIGIPQPCLSLAERMQLNVLLLLYSEVALPWYAAVQWASASSRKRIPVGIYGLCQSEGQEWLI